LQLYRLIGFEVKLDKGDGAENAPIYESNNMHAFCPLDSGI